MCKKSLFFSGNPLLCDAAFPEIAAIMQTNHTRLYGVSHCGPLSEQPVTTRPSRFLGYIPEGMSPPPSTVAEHIYNNQQQQIAANENQVSPLYVPPPAIHRQSDHLEFRTVDLNARRTATLDEHILEPDVIDENPSDSNQEIKYKRANVTLSGEEKPNDTISEVGLNEEGRNVTANLTLPEPTLDEQQIQNDEPPTKVLIDPIAQERQLSKMATEIELLRSQIEQLAEQNRMLLNQQKMLSKTDFQTESTLNESLENN